MNIQMWAVYKNGLFIGSVWASLEDLYEMVMIANSNYYLTGVHYTYMGDYIWKV